MDARWMCVCGWSQVLQCSISDINVCIHRDVHETDRVTEAEQGRVWEICPSLSEAELQRPEM